MHPQANLPQSVAQRQQAAQQKKDQPEEFSQYQKYQEVMMSRFDVDEELAKQTPLAAAASTRDRGATSCSNSIFTESARSASAGTTAG